MPVDSIQLLSLAANVAQILGVSIQIVDKVKGSKADPREGYFLFLKELVQVSRAWKEFHQYYHLILGDVQALKNTIDRGREGKNPKQLDNISAEDISDIMNSHTLVAFYEDFSIKLSRPSGRIEKTFSPDIRQLDVIITEISQNPISNIENNISSLRECRDIVLRNHGRVCEFMKWGMANYRIGNWTKNKRGELLEYSRCLSVDFPNVIKESDRALINILSVYEEFLSKAS